jgi:predicted AAA+ superfamily ATPase
LKLQIFSVRRRRDSQGFLKCFFFFPLQGEKYGEDLFYYYGNVEVDFCLFEHQYAFQVSYSIKDAATRERELGALKAYHKRYPNSKLFVITMDEEETIIYEAVVIEVLPVWKWLLMEK